MSVAAVRVEAVEGGDVVQLVLDAPPGNIVGIATCGALVAALERVAAEGRARMIVLRGEGEHFSYGASIPEHLPEQAPAMLDAMGGAVRALLSCPIPTLALMHGRCLGGGFELALACGMAWVEAGARLGAPEIRLGVLAPAATVLLEDRVPEPLRQEWLLTGRDIGAQEAVTAGIASRLIPAGGLSAAVDTFARDHLRDASRVALLASVTATRRRRAGRLARRLASVETLYRTAFLSDPEGSEGVRAFLEKRQPEWRRP